MNPGSLLRPCVETDFWQTPAFALFDKSMIKKFRDPLSRAKLLLLPKFEWDNIFYDYVDEQIIQEAWPLTPSTTDELRR